MDESMTPDRRSAAASDQTVAPGVVGTMDWLRRARDDFAARTIALSPDELVAYVGEAAAVARADIAATARAIERQVPAA